MTDDVLLWTSHPIVQHAIEATGGDPLLVMEKMVETMNDLEERFPGRPFSDILSPQRRYDKSQALKALMENGYEADEAKEMLGYHKDQRRRSRVPAG